MPNEPPQPLDYANPPRRPISALAITSLVLGLIATPLDLAYELGLLFGIAAIALGFTAIARINKLNQTGKALAIAGIILGLVSLLIGITCGILLTRDL